jgi:hypothetical protein
MNKLQRVADAIANGALNRDLVIDFDLSPATVRIYRWRIEKCQKEGLPIKFYPLGPPKPDRKKVKVRKPRMTRRERETYWGNPPTKPPPVHYKLTRNQMRTRLMEDGRKAHLLLQDETPPAIVLREIGGSRARIYRALRAYRSTLQQAAEDLL